MKLAIFLPNWLGDLVMATPTLRAIRRHVGSDAHIVGILRPKLRDVLADTSWLDEEWAFDPRGQDPQYRRWALIRRLRKERFDMAVLLSNSLDTALVAWLGSVRQRVGYVRYGRGPLLTKKLQPLRRDGVFIPAPMVLTYLALAEAIGCPPESPRLELATTESEEKVGDQIWRQLGLRTDGRVIALNFGGAFGAAKRWSPEHGGLLAQRIASELDHDVLMICGPGEEPVAREIVANAKHPRVFSLADQPLGIATTKSCLRRIRLFVSTDSGPTHIASAFGKPVITLFGPTSPRWIENPTVHGNYLRLDLDCLECAKRVCPYGHNRCMTELTPDIVFKSVIKILESGDSTCACST